MGDSKQERQGTTSTTSLSSTTSSTSIGSVVSVVLSDDDARTSAPYNAQPSSAAPNGQQSQQNAQNNNNNNDQKDDWSDVSIILPLNILLQEMKQPSVKKRVASVKTIPSISIALGPSKTRALLVPFLAQLMTEEDEIQKEILKLLPSFVNLIGGSYHAHLLMDIVFDYLYKCDDSNAKEIALNAAKDLFRKIDLRHFQKLLMDFMNRTLENEHFCAKEIALTLMPEIFIALSEDYQSEIIAIFVRLAEDSTPMVRKTAASKLKDFAKLIPPAPESQLLNVFDKLLNDENDYVRMPLLESLIPFSQVCIEKSPEEFLSILERILADKSVKVRSNVVDFIEDMHRAFPQNVIDDILIPTYLSFLNTDAENDLKNRALINIVALYKNIPNFDALFLPKLKALAKDKSLSVKNNLGEAIVNLLTEGERKRLEGVDSVFSEILSESDSEVKFKIFKKIKDFGQLQQTMNLSIVNILLASQETILALKKWRMRASVQTTIAKIVVEGKLPEDQFSEDFIRILKVGFRDNTADVRKEAAKAFGQIASNFSPRFVASKLLPELYELWEEPNYLFRISAMFCVKAILQKLDSSFVETELFKYIQKSAQDIVPNIRIAAIDVIVDILTTFSQQKTTTNVYRKEILQNLANNDSDRQVAKYAFDTLKL